MGDIHLGLGIVLAASLILLVAGTWIGRRLGRAWVTFCAILIVAGLFLFGMVLLDGTWVARVLPVSNVIVVGNWQLPLASLLIGMVWHHLPKSSWRRAVLGVVVLCIAGWRTVGPIAARPPSMGGNRWINNVCLQSSSSTCTAAAAASLLRAAGIPATEREMAGLCLSGVEGTTFLGAYRGLTLKTAGTPWRVEVVDEAATLRTSPTPILVTVGLPRYASGVDVRYSRDWGWAPGFRHSVVLYRYLANGNVEIGDPAIGLEQWGPEGIDVLWRGKGLRLVPR